MSSAYWSILTPPSIVSYSSPLINLRISRIIKEQKQGHLQQDQTVGETKDLLVSFGAQNSRLHVK